MRRHLLLTSLLLPLTAAQSAAAQSATALSATAQSKVEKHLLQNRERLRDVMRADHTAASRIARMDGKYRMLLSQVKVAQVVDGKVVDLGFQPAGTLRGRKIPAGYRVLISPYCFVFAESGAPARRKRQWGPEQATGAPSKSQGSTSEAAWSPATQNNPRPEWLLVEFDPPVDAVRILVYESFQPAATHINRFRSDGSEVTIWRAPAARSENRSRIIGADISCRQVSRIKVYLDTATVLGFNEIDAIGAKGPKGRIRWATSAAASSTHAAARSDLPEAYSPGATSPTATDSGPRPNTIRQLHAENQKLRARLQALEIAIEKLRARRNPR